MEESNKEQTTTVADKKPPETSFPAESGWAATMLYMGWLVITLAVILGLSSVNSPSLIWTAGGFAVIGFQLLFLSFIVGVFTDMRWYLRKLYEGTVKSSEGGEDS